MRTVFLALSLLSAALFATGCRGGGGPPVSTTPDDLPPDQPPPLVPVVFDAPDRQSDRFLLNTAAVAGDILTVEVSYGGGCREHVFTLAADDTFMESDPVQLRMTLIHDANEDPCQRWVTEERRFDLSPVKNRFREIYDQDSGTIHLNLSPAPASNLPLVYEF